MRGHPGYEGFPDGFFDRGDEADDAIFYGPPRLVTHIDDGAIAAVGELYRELAIEGSVLDLMSSWISHFDPAPRHLTALGMNAAELEANPVADAAVVHDLNTEPTLPFGDATFDHVVCAVSVDYLVQPLEVFAEVGRVLRPGGRFVCTFSNRLFATKAVRGWLVSSDEQRCRIVREYFVRSGGFDPPTVETRRPAGFGSDPLFAVHSTAGVGRGLE